MFNDYIWYNKLNFIPNIDYIVLEWVKEGVFVFSKIDIIRKAMDATWLKSQAISNNMANVNTPGYKKQTVEFNDVLQSYVDQSNGISSGLNKTNTKHMSVNNSIGPSISVDESGQMRVDGNNVDVDKEMAEDAENSIQYNYLTKQISDEFRRIKLAIRDGR